MLASVGQKGKHVTSRIIHRAAKRKREQPGRILAWLWPDLTAQPLKSQSQPHCFGWIFGLVHAGGCHASAAIAIRSPVMPRTSLRQGRIDAGFDVAFGLTTNCGEFRNNQIA